MYSGFLGTRSWCDSDACRELNQIQCHGDRESRRGKTCIRACAIHPQEVRG
jgi:hypothetical protein